MRTPDHTKPVILRRIPIGRAASRRAAIRLALSFATAIDRALLDAGWRLACHDRSGAFAITLKP